MDPVANLFFRLCHAVPVSLERLAGTGPREHRQAGFGACETPRPIASILARPSRCHRVIAAIDNGTATSSGESGRKESCLTYVHALGVISS